MPTNKNGHKRLTHLDSFKVCTWIEAKREFLAQTRESYPELVDACRKATGVDVAKQSLQSLMTELGVVREKSSITNVKASDEIRTINAKIDAILRDMKAELVRTSDGGFSLLALK